MRRLLFLLTFLLVSVSVFAQTNNSAQGWCEQGGQHLVVNPGITSTGFVQASFPQCTVTVYLHNTVTPAVIFSDDATPPTMLANPFTATTAGHWQFYASNTSYDVVLSGAGFPAPFTLRDVIIPGTGGGGPTTPACNPITPLAAAITAAYNLLPATGGVIDCSLSGNSTLLSDPFSPMIKNVTVIMPIGTTSAAIPLNIPANVIYSQGNGGCLNNSSTTNISGTIVAGLYQIFCGSGFVSILLNNQSDFPQWFGAKGNGGGNDAPAIQAAIDACRGAGPIFNATCFVTLTDGNFVITSTLNMYANQNGGAYYGMKLIGSGPYSTVINYQGSNTSSVIRMIGQQQTLADIHIIGSGWLDAVQYDGQSNIGISTKGRIENVLVECDGVVGNGFTAGRTHYQADQATFLGVRVVGCNSGYGFAIMDANAVSNNLINPSMAVNWIGVGSTVPTGDIAILGGEFDDNDVDFLPGPGISLSVTGVRTEGSKVGVSTVVGSYPSPMTFQNFLIGSTWWSEHTSQPRPATNATCTDSTHITLSVPNSVTFADYITIAGAGPAGALLHTHIASMTDPLHATLDMTSCSVLVSAAAVNYDTSVEQNHIYLTAGGPYVINGSYFGSVQHENAFVIPTGSLTLTGVGFHENFTYPNPLNINPTGGAWGSSVSWTGLWYNDTPSTRMKDHSNPTAVPNLFFVTNNVMGAANNAWILNGTEPLVNGMVLSVVVDMYTLQAGANTITYNGTSQNVIQSSNLANLGSTVPTGSIAQFLYDGSNLRMLGR